MPVKLLRYGRRNLQACVMMAWLPLIVLGLVVSGVVTALMREPGVRLYDWIATRARRPQPAVQRRIPETECEPLTQTS
ncbi:hypothetical protein [Achromobacter animicus]|uniref:hypothetical protein n=1 Tax=Achromobacter animicus TaxID=1389935 RepID=UPI002446C348|nr:hypothetical protein [Achromobacter animicus]MDH0685675.1 hypothetical protein [Achromobacter animicus]